MKRLLHHGLPGGRGHVFYTTHLPCKSTYKVLGIHTAIAHFTVIIFGQNKRYITIFNHSIRYCIQLALEEPISLSRSEGTRSAFEHINRVSRIEDGPPRLASGIVSSPPYLVKFQFRVKYTSRRYAQTSRERKSIAPPGIIAPILPIASSHDDTLLKRHN